jgi:hypothetical protein
VAQRFQILIVSGHCMNILKFCFFCCLSSPAVAVE